MNVNDIPKWIALLQGIHRGEQLQYKSPMSTANINTWEDAEHIYTTSSPDNYRTIRKPATLWRMRYTWSDGRFTEGPAHGTKEGAELLALKLSRSVVGKKAIEYVERVRE